MQEQKISLNSYFVTLTYDQEHIPIVIDGDEVLSNTLVVDDLQKFMKKVRNYSHGKLSKPIRYFGVGEYGRKTNRPHYHLIMFNVPNMDEVDNNPVLKAWDKGFAYIGDVNVSSIHYVTKYCLKHRRFNGVGKKPFAVMSRRGAIGSGYLTDEVIRWHSEGKDYRNYAHTDSGHKVKLPRYYADKIFSATDKEEIREANRVKTDKWSIEEVERIIDQGDNIGIHEINRKDQYIQKINEILNRSTL